MVELKDAITNGKAFIFEVFDKPEEIILDSANREDSYWLVKYRVLLNIKPLNGLQNVLGISKRIFYKTVKIDENGEIVGILDEDLPRNSTSDKQPQAA